MIVSERFLAVWFNEKAYWILNEPCLLFNSKLCKKTGTLVPVFILAYFSFNTSSMIVITLSISSFLTFKGGRSLATFGPAVASKRPFS